ncbi:MAG: sulfotransferase family 2 domain-containing protein [Aestuariivita sp.]|nr:sulfotransferase family 2 domain-containing protein [Aestuariivita sp.]
MIISHKLKVIYIRVQKTASTSFEMALSKYCGPEDVITKLGRGQDEIRESLGYCGGQNFKEGRYREYKQHHRATVIKNNVPIDIWESYTKIANIRNPYDKMISKYYDEHQKTKEEDILVFAEWIEKIAKKSEWIASFLYGPIHIDGKLVIDFCIRYEHLIEDIKALETKIACPGLSKEIQKYSFQSEHRPNQKGSLYEIYSKYPEAKSIIDKELYKYIDKYELLRSHWLKHKSELEQLLDGGGQKVRTR